MNAAFINDSEVQFCCFCYLPDFFFFLQVVLCQNKCKISHFMYLLVFVSIRLFLTLTPIQDRSHIGFIAMTVELKKMKNCCSILYVLVFVIFFLSIFSITLQIIVSIRALEFVTYCYCILRQGKFICTAR